MNIQHKETHAEKKNVTNGGENEKLKKNQKKKGGTGQNRTEVEKKRGKPEQKQVITGFYL